jgi:putative CocE/NonD family hydrolase
MHDEYLAQEQDDAVEALAWIGRQSWSTGAVGLLGISWGGFNALQIAARRPPELKAIITHCSTDDRYADDVHYRGGCMLDYNIIWAGVMLTLNGRPPDPLHVGDRWREMWLNRLQNNLPWIEPWLRHQRRDAFWKHGSVGEDYSAITCAVYAVGGWADPYTDAILRLLAGLPGPRKGLIGPWGHQYPESAAPGPAIGFNQESLRWWNYWLKGIDTGIMDEPMLRVWMQDRIEPQPFYQERPGRWVVEPVWPSPTSELHGYALNAGTLDDVPGTEVRLDYVGAQYTGLDAGESCAFGAPPHEAGDQRRDDGLSLTFTSEPLETSLELLGFPEVTLTVAVDRPRALIAVRLCDVAPTGASLLLSYGLLNLTHRESHEHPTPLEPGRRYTVTMRLNALGYVVPAGHCLRVAISPTYWPHAWPSPETVTLSVFTGGDSQIRLPVRPARPEDANIAPFEPAEGAPVPPLEYINRSASRRTVSHDLINGLFETTVTGGRGFRLVQTGLELINDTCLTHSIRAGDPLSATIRYNYTISIGRGAWQTRVETTSVMSSDAERYLITQTLDAYEGNTRIFARSWVLESPRDMS